MAKTPEDILNDILAKGREKSQTGIKERPVKPAPGKTVWRILPGWNDANPLQFFHPYGQHYVKDAEGTIKAVVVCPDKTFSDSCDLCDVISAAAKNARDDSLREQILESRATQNFLMNAVQVENGDGSVKILTVGTMLFNSILDALQEYGPDFLDPVKGNDIVIDRTGTGMNTKYTATVRSASKSKPVQQSHMAARHNLDEYVKEDFEAKKKKALETLGATFATLGVTGGPSLAALTGPASTAAGVEPDLSDLNLDDEIPEEFRPQTEAKTPVEEAEIVEEAPKAAPAKETVDADFGAELQDDDLDALLADIA